MVNEGDQARKESEIATTHMTRWHRGECLAKRKVTPIRREIALRSLLLLLTPYLCEWLLHPSSYKLNPDIDWVASQILDISYL